MCVCVCGRARARACVCIRVFVCVLYAIERQIKNVLLYKMFVSRPELFYRSSVHADRQHIQGHVLNSIHYWYKRVGTYGLQMRRLIAELAIFLPGLFVQEQTEIYT